RARADRRRRAVRAARARAPPLRGDRAIARRRLYRRQPLDRGIGHLDPARLRRGARALPRPHRGGPRLHAGRAVGRGRRGPASRRALVGRGERVRDGDFLAVVADDETLAMKAADIVRRHCVWEGGTPIPVDAGEPEFLTAQPSKDRVIESGAPRPSGNAARMLEATYSRPCIAHASLAPSCALGNFTDGRLTVWTHAQGVYQLRN